MQILRLQRDMQKEMIRLLSISLLILFCLGCRKDQPFDAIEWKSQPADWWMSDIRENMIADLIATDTLTDMTPGAVTNLLGKPEITQSDTLLYLIREYYESTDIDPVEIRYLLLSFSESGQVSNVKVVSSLDQPSINTKAPQ